VIAGQRSLLRAHGVGFWGSGFVGKGLCLCLRL